MSAIPDGIVLERHRDLAGTRGGRVQAALAAALLVFLLLGLLGVFGQRPVTTHAIFPAATLEVAAPTRIRGGLLYQARFRIRPRRDMKNAILVLGSGWLENMTIDTIEPSPLGQASRHGSLVLTLGHIPAGGNYTLYFQYQVNPTNVGSRSQNVELDDGPRVVGFVHRSLTVFP